VKLFAPATGAPGFGGLFGELTAGVFASRLGGGEAVCAEAGITAASSRSEVIDFRIGISMFEMSDLNSPWRATFRSAHQNMYRSGTLNTATSASGVKAEMSNDMKQPKQRCHNASVKRHLRQSGRRIRSNQARRSDKFVLG
jgi:hypothetical protein